MNKRGFFIQFFLLISTLALVTPAAYGQSDVKTKAIEGFGGVIAERYADSKEWWPPEKTPSRGRA